MALPHLRFQQFRFPEQSFAQRFGRWSWIILLAIILHFALLISKMRLLFQSVPPKPLDVRTLSPEELENFKRDWERNRKFLLKQTQKETDAPVPEARFESDKNSKVEKETRARNTNVLPQEPTAAAPPSQAHQETKAESQSNTKNVATVGKKLSLKQLGIRMDLGAPKAERRTESVARNIAPNVFQDQSLQEDALEEGERNLLNTERSRFYTFYARLYEAIAPLWNSKVSSAFESGKGQYSPGAAYTTLAEVILTPSGELVDVVIVQSSGIKAFDQAVTDSWRKISRFPNPPKDLVKPDGYVHTGWTFTVNISEQAGVRFLAPERRY